MRIPPHPFADDIGHGLAPEGALKCEMQQPKADSVTFSH